MEILKGIYSRRSVRNFTSDPVSDEQLWEIVKAGSWAPSGLNNQPWRFVIIRQRAVLNKLAQKTKYRRILEEAPAAVAVFIDHSSTYNDVKDHQAIGACLQNMLLTAHALDLGAVWLGEILNKAEEVRALLELSEGVELMAVVALGHPAHRDQQSTRKDIEDLVLKVY